MYTCLSDTKLIFAQKSGVFGLDDVGLDIPPVFVLSDQNFPSMIPAGGEGDGTCLKIILIEHGTLAELVSVFLEIAKGFAIPAGTQATWQRQELPNMRLNSSRQMQG
jgi:hypothetical protein